MASPGAASPSRSRRAVTVTRSRSTAPSKPIRSSARARSARVRRRRRRPLWRRSLRGGLSEAAPPRAVDRSDQLVYQIIVDRFRRRGRAGHPGLARRSRGRDARRRARRDRERLLRAARRDHALALAALRKSARRSPRARRPAVRGLSRLLAVAAARRRSALGGEAALDALVAAAHARGLRVIVDAVPNHVHVSHPLFTITRRLVQLRRAGCVCGAPGCDWGGHMETCWFGPELPDLNWRNPAVARSGHRRSGMVAVALFARRAAPRRGADDAARGHAPDGGGARTARAPTTLVLGEVYTGPGDGGRAQIRAYLGRAGRRARQRVRLSADVGARARDRARSSGGFAALERELQRRRKALRGLGRDHRAHAGNHDRRASCRRRPATRAAIPG